MARSAHLARSRYFTVIDSLLERLTSDTQSAQAAGRHLSLKITVRCVYIVPRLLWQKPLTMMRCGRALLAPAVGAPVESSVDAGG